VEHYEISGYTTARNSRAAQAESDRGAAVQILAEEENADQLLKPSRSVAHVGRQERQR